MRHLIVNLIGPQASGKTTIAKELGYPVVITTTTRQPRQNESSNTYNFVSKEEYSKNEYIMPTKINGNLYGVNKEIFEAMYNKYKVITIVTDLEGTKYLKEKYKDKVLTILVVSSKDYLKKRLLERNGVEIDLEDYDYSKVIDYSDKIVLNNTCDNLEFNRKEIKNAVNQILLNQSLL